MRAGEMLEGQEFRTRLTKRKGKIIGHSDIGVLVEWRYSGAMKYLAPEIELDAMDWCRPADGGIGTH